MFTPDLIVPFLAVALAELGDKSQILVFLLASRTKKHLQLLIGVMLGFLVVDGFALLVGSWVVQVVPDFWLQVVSGLVFIVLGILMLYAKHDDEESVPTLKNPLSSGFLLILIAEWGDKTQIASALFATEYDLLYVFIAVMGALFLLSVSALYLGKFIAHRIDKKITTRVAGVIFIIIGLLALFF